LASSTDAQATAQPHHQLLPHPTAQMGRTSRHRLRAEEVTTTNSRSTVTGRDETSRPARSPSRTHCVSWAKAAFRDPPPRHRDKPNSKAVSPTQAPRDRHHLHGADNRGTEARPRQSSTPHHADVAQALRPTTPQRCLHGPARRAVLDQLDGDSGTADQSSGVAEPIYPARRRGIARQSGGVGPCAGERQNLPVDVWPRPATTPPVNQTPILRKQGPSGRVLGLPDGVSVQAGL